MPHAPNGWGGALRGELSGLPGWAVGGGQFCVVAGLAVATIGMAALAYAVWPIFLVVAAAATLHALASCVLGPAIAAISLGLVGPLAIGERLGRNARFASLGNGSAAALMGACGFFGANQGGVFGAFLLAIPTLLAPSPVPGKEN